MRWVDRYIGLLGASFVFGAVVLWGAGAPGLVLAIDLALVGAALGLMAVRTMRAPRVVLVGEPTEAPLYSLQEDLDEAGFGLRFCRGPGRRPCPVLEGRPCPVPGHPVAAAIVRRPGQTGPLPPCGKGLGVPVVTVRLDRDGALGPAVRDVATTAHAVRVLVGA